MLESRDAIRDSEPGEDHHVYMEQVVPEIGVLRQQLHFATEEMKFLESLQTTGSQQHEQVEPGAVIMTDRGIFFISVSIEQFHVNGMKVTGLSVKSPLFRAMRGKSKDDCFTYSGTTYRILDIL